MSNESISSLVGLLKTLAHPIRLRMLALLRAGDLCVCQVTAILGIPASTASEHLTELRKSGLLTEKKAGRWVYYSLQPQEELKPLVAVLWSHLDKADQVAQDRSADRAIREVPVEITCARIKPCRTAKRPRKVGGHAE